MDVLDSVASSAFGESINRSRSSNSISGVELYEDDGVLTVSSLTSTSNTSVSTRGPLAPANRVARELFREERLLQTANRQGNKIFFFNNFFIVLTYVVFLVCLSLSGNFLWRMKNLISVPIQTSVL